MTIDVRACHAGTMFSIGIEDDPLPMRRSVLRFGLPLPAWGFLRAVLATRGSDKGAILTRTAPTRAVRAR
jgi:hypothetical protein